jgi:hypothetical protein
MTKTVIQTAKRKVITKNEKINWLLYGLLWLWIGFVSSVDSYLVIRYQNSMGDHEQNPIARWIMSEDGWDVSRFIGMKMFLTITILGFLLTLYSHHKKIGYTVMLALAVFQTALLWYQMNY